MHQAACQNEHQVGDTAEPNAEVVASLNEGSTGKLLLVVQHAENDPISLTFDDGEQIEATLVHPMVAA